MTERDAKGRFVQGNRGGPGRPRREIEERYLLALVRRVPLKEWRIVVDKALEQAQAGDDRARRWLADYIIGKPTEYVSADVTSGGVPLALALVDYSSLTDDELRAILSRRSSGGTGEPDAGAPEPD